MTAPSPETVSALEPTAPLPTPFDFGALVFFAQTCEGVPPTPEEFVSLTLERKRQAAPRTRARRPSIVHGKWHPSATTARFTMRTVRSCWPVMLQSYAPKRVPVRPRRQVATVRAKREMHMHVDVSEIERLSDQGNTWSFRRKKKVTSPPDACTTVGSSSTSLSSTATLSSSRCHHHQEHFTFEPILCCIEDS